MHTPLFDESTFLTPTGLNFPPYLWKLVATALCSRLTGLKPVFQSISDLSPPDTPTLRPFIAKAYPHPFSYTHSVPLASSNLPTKPPNPTFDVICLPLFLHRCQDPVLYLSYLHACLKPGGLLLASFWGGETLWSLRTALAEADYNCFGKIYERLPPLMRLQDTLGLLKSIPFHQTSSDEDKLEFSLPHFHYLTQTLRAMKEISIFQPHVRPPFSLKIWREAKALFKRQYGAKKITIKAQLITLTGWKKMPLMS